VLTPLPEATLNTDRNGFVQSLPNAAIFDYSHDGVMRSFDASMQRLRVSGVAVLLAHDLGRLTHGGEHESRMRDFLDGGYKAMQALRAQGRVGAIGIGVNEIEVCQDLLQRVELDCVLLAGRYTLLEQGAIESLLPECLRRRVGVIIGGPFNSGVLVESAAINYVPHYNYAPAPASIVQRARRLRDICAAHGVPIGAAALQFPLAHAAVVSVIPGVRSAEQVQEAIRFMDSPIPAALWHELRHASLLNPAAPAPSPGIG
jgi:D-threo-aldose 1-dehydrogenase